MCNGSRAVVSSRVLVLCNVHRGPALYMLVALIRYCMRYLGQLRSTVTDMLHWDYVAFGTGLQKM
jgi:hypothetical protein